jgi:VWFA-related protein
VVVTDGSGKPVSGLQQQDFTVLDNKKPQTLQSSRESLGTGANTELPARALVVVDAVNNSVAQVAFARGQVEKFLRRGAGELPLPMSLALVTDKHWDQSPFTRDRNALLAALNAQPSGIRIHHRAQGVEGDMERTDSSLQTLQKLVGAQTSPPGRMLLIWLGEGWPYLEGNNVGLTTEGMSGMFRYVVWVSTELREHHITLYNLNAMEADERFDRAFYYQQFLNGVGSAKKVQPGNAALQVFSVQSGGLVLNRSNDIGDSLASCLADAEDYYTLSFDSAEAGHADEYHNLQVKIDKPGLTARTRTGYYAQP